MSRPRRSQGRAGRAEPRGMGSLQPLLRHGRPGGRAEPPGAGRFPAGRHHGGRGRAGAHRRRGGAAGVRGGAAEGAAAARLPARAQRAELPRALPGRGAAHPGGGGRGGPGRGQDGAAAPPEPGQAVVAAAPLRVQALRHLHGHLLPVQLQGARRAGLHRQPPLLLPPRGGGLLPAAAAQHVHPHGRGRGRRHQALHRAPLPPEHRLLAAVRAAAGRLLVGHAHLHAAPLARHQAPQAHPLRRAEAGGQAEGAGRRPGRGRHGAVPLQTDSPEVQVGRHGVHQPQQQPEAHGQQPQGGERGGAGPAGSGAGVHQVPDGHREAPGHAAHQGAEDAAPHLGAVAAQPQAARARLAAHGRLRAPRGARAALPGRGAQLQGQGSLPDLRGGPGVRQLRHGQRPRAHPREPDPQHALGREPPRVRHGPRAPRRQLQHRAQLRQRRRGLVRGRHRRAAGRAPRDAHQQLRQHLPVLRGFHHQPGEPGARLHRGRGHPAASVGAAGAHAHRLPPGPRGPLGRGPQGALAGESQEDPGGLPLRAPALVAPPLRHRQVRRRPAAGAAGLPGAQAAPVDLGAGARPALDPALQDPGDLGRQRDDRARAQRRVPAPDQEAVAAVAAAVPAAGARPQQQRELPERPEELRQELCGVQPGVLPAAGQGQAQREHPAGRRGPHHPHRLWVHPEQLPPEPRLRDLGLQTDHRVRGRDGRPGRGHVQLLQDADAAGADRRPQAHGQGGADRGDHAARLAAALLPRLLHHPAPQGAFPHEPDGGAAAAAGGADGGRLHEIHHHQALRRLPVPHQRHHVKPARAEGKAKRQKKKQQKKFPGKKNSRKNRKK